MRIPSNKIADVVRFFRDELKNTYEKDELETFIAYCFEEYLNLKRADIFLNFDVTISESELLKFNFAIKDLKQHKPIQYIFGKADFYGLKFIVNKHVLIPRPETEELVQLIISRTKKQESRAENQEPGTNVQEPSAKNQDLAHLALPIFILDIGTGSGCIPVALKKNIPLAKVYALDISAEALDIAKQNAELNTVDVEFFQHNILSANDMLPDSDLKFDIIVSNPPYICVSEKEQMQNNVLDHEPHLALFVNDNDPLLFYRSIADFALKNLKQNGELYFEINQAFGPETKLLLEKRGFKNIVLVKDINNNNRILYCTI
ncbi:MAG: peptide chain release factor N(5)-glutamine methyltransferase [Bacteroidota bacterium]